MFLEGEVDWILVLGLLAAVTSILAVASLMFAFTHRTRHVSTADELDAVSKAREAAESAPETAVDAQKRGRVTGAAKVYLARYGTNPPAVRFDVVAIVWPRGRSPQLRHMPGAFEAEGPKSK